MKWMVLFVTLEVLAGPLRTPPHLLGRACAGDVPSEVGAMLSYHRPLEGAREDFERGYRRHLEWHEARADSLTWYGWDVVSGRGQGRFVDGTFGISFEALDQRVDPAGDREDTRASYGGHRREAGRSFLRLRPDLSSAAPLESGSTTTFVQVVRYRVAAPHRADFERVLLQACRSEVAFAPFTVYEMLTGASGSDFILFVWRDALGTFDDASTDPARAIRTGLAAKPSLTVAEEQELWRFRRDLTRFGSRTPEAR